MSYTNSPLIDYTLLSPHYTKGRNHVIDTITPHCVVGQVTVERLGDIFNGTRNASSNYGVGFDGRVGMYVEECNRSWCTSSKSNDNRAITIEIASDNTNPYAITDEAMASTIRLIADICKRNNIPEMKWEANKFLIGNIERQNFSVHRWFANKSCPGDFIFGKLPYIALEVNKLLGAIEIVENYKVTATKIVETKAQSEVLQMKLARLGMESIVEAITETEPIEPIVINPYIEPTRVLMLSNTLMHGEDVKWLQWELSKADCYTMDIDGWLGNGSDNAIREYQAEHGLTIDGKVGSATRNCLKND